MNDRSQEPDTNTIDAADAGIEELLRKVGARNEPSPAVTNDVMRAVHAEWRAVVDERVNRRRFVGYGMAASVAAAALAVALLVRTTPPLPAMEIASIARIEGRVHVGDANGVREASSGETVRDGAVLTTDGESRAALRFADGLSVRVDSGSTLLMAAADKVVLRAGAVYVDAQPNGVPHPLNIETVAGSVRHIGTQYQVRAVGGGVEISVREGRVELTNRSGVNGGVAGERLRVTHDGQIARDKVSPQDASWQWAVRVAPPFDIADSSVGQFLEWAARETGRSVRYGSEAAERSAATVKLHGSIAGLDPETALAAVLSTTGLQRTADDDESLTIDLRRD